MPKHYIWFGCITVGPLLAYASAFSPRTSVLAIVFIIVGAKGILLDIL